MIEPPTTTPSFADHGPYKTDLTIQVSGPVQAVPGETTIYTLSVGNRGPTLATGIRITDNLSTGAIPVWVRPAHPLCGRQGRGVRCKVDGLQDGDAVSVTLDLSAGGVEAPMTGTQLAGLTWDPSVPACVIERDPPPRYLTCHLTSLQPGAESQMHIAVGAADWATATLVHTASVTANEVDANHANNRATFTTMVSPSISLPPPEQGKPGVPVTVTAVPTAADLVLQADVPPSIIAGQPFTCTFIITNRGALATGVRFENTLPPATRLEAYAPGLPLCEQRDDALTCTLRDFTSGETVTFTLVITGHAGQAMIIEPDPLMPGWPICTVLKERTFLHIVNCELGVLKPDQATQVQLTFVAKGVQERTMTNTASVSANEADLDPLDNTNTTTVSVGVQADLSVRSVISGPAVAGKTLSYTLTVINLGPSEAAGVVLADTLPPGTSLVSAIPSQGDDCRVEQETPSTDVVICRLGRLNREETATLTVIVAVDESLALELAETITLSARVVSELADPNPSNNDWTKAIPLISGIKD